MAKIYTAPLRTSYQTKKTGTPWKSVVVIAVLNFCNFIQFSLYFSSLWPYLQVLDKTSTEQYFGIVLSAFSLAQIIACPLVGYWSNRSEHLRSPLVFCHSLSAIGNCVYFGAQLANNGTKRRLMVLLARMVLGFGSGAIGLFQSYAVMASTIDDRPRAIALITGGGALGLTTGPALQLLFTPLGYPGFEISNGLLFNMYTAPAFFGLLASLLGIFVLYSVFEERYAGMLEKNGTTQEHDEDLPSYDKLAVLICCITKFTQMFTFTNVETIGSPLAMNMFGFNKHEAVTVVAVAHTFLSATAFSVNASVAFTKLGRHLNSRKLCITALLLLVLFHILTYSYSSLSGHLVLYNNSDLHNGTSEPVGCNVDRFHWCESVKPVNKWIFYIAYSLCIGVAFPSINLSMNTLYSRIIGPRRQETLQGVQQMFGSVARFTGPLMISNIYHYYGPTVSWQIEFVTLFATIALWIRYYDRMVPLRLKKTSREDCSTTTSTTSLTSLDSNEKF